jgi:hypothetical protein
MSTHMAFNDNLRPKRQLATAFVGVDRVRKYGTPTGIIDLHARTSIARTGHSHLEKGFIWRAIFHGTVDENETPKLLSTHSQLRD